MDLEKMQTSARTASELLKLLGHADRLMVLCQLKLGEQSVGELSESVGIKQSALSQHLARMRHSIAGDKVIQIISLLYELYCAEDE